MRHPKPDQKSELPLSAVPELLPEDARAAEVIARELGRRSRDVRVRRRTEDRLIRYIWGMVP